jgi:uncharacterized membrane protein YidH (DUF202 family)
MTAISKHKRSDRNRDALTCPKHAIDSDSIIINEAQLILAEKRTSMAAMRTGIAIFALPLSVLGLLIATSRYYDILQVLPLVIPLGVMLAGLIMLGGYLIVQSLMNIRHHDQMILQLKSCHSKLSQFLD